MHNILNKIFPFIFKNKKSAPIKNIQDVRKSYEDILLRLSKKLGKEKIKVVFIVRENQKWTYQSVYDLFAADERFEPVVLVSLLMLSHIGKDKTRNNLEENYNFFKSRGMTVDYLYKNGEYLDLKDFKPDIVFYDQQYDFPDFHKPEVVSEYALTCYSSYSYALMDSDDGYTNEFHAYLYRLYFEHDLNLKRYESYNRFDLSNCRVVGYPKLDVYLDNKPAKIDIWKDKDKIKIIYAPHHSVDKRGLHLSMFVQSSKEILEFARRHPETTWVFKPHPRLKYALLRTKTMSQDKIEEYFDEWKKIGAVYEQGDYFDLFKTSDLMITDGCSFLAEYLPTKKPLIRIVNKTAVHLNNLGEKVISEYYIAENKTEFEKYFNELIVNKNDCKKEARLKLINEIIDFNESAAHKIYTGILNDIKNA